MMEYETKDFYLSVLLLTKGFKFNRSQKQDDGVHFWFEYENPVEFADTLNEFINCTATVNLRKYTKNVAFMRRELDKHR